MLKKKMIVFSAICLVLFLSVDVFSNKEDLSVYLQTVATGDSVIVVGQHVIAMDGFSDEVYSSAMKNSIDKRVYYKSEFSDDKYVDITNLSSIDEIINGESNFDVLKTEIKYYTHSDGITKDLKTDEVIPYYNILNPYDLENLDELRPIFNYAKDSQDENIRSIVDQIIGIDFEADPKFDDYDSKLIKLYDYFEYLRSGEVDTKYIKDIIRSIDFSRRRDVFNELLNVMNKEHKFEDMFFDIAYKEVYENVKKSFEFYSNDKFSDIGTTLSKFKNTYYQRLYEEILKLDYESADLIYKELSYIDDVMELKIVDVENQIDIIDNIIDSSLYIDYLTNGIKSSDQYTTAEDRIGVLEIEQEFLIEQRLIRTANSYKLEFLDNLYDEAIKLELHRDEFYGVYASSKSNYVQFIKKLKNQTSLVINENKGQDEPNNIDVSPETNEETVNIKKICKRFFEDYENYLDVELISYIKKIDDSEKLRVYLSALNMYIETSDSDDAKQILKSTIVNNSKNGILFRTLAVKLKDYIPVSKIAEFNKMSYIRNDSLNQVTIADKDKYYKYTKESNMVITENGTSNMEYDVFSTPDDIYLEQGYAENTFSIEITTLFDSNLNFIIDEKTKMLGNELFKLLLE